MFYAFMLFLLCWEDVCAIVLASQSSASAQRTFVRWKSDNAFESGQLPKHSLAS